MSSATSRHAFGRRENPQAGYTERQRRSSGRVARCRIIHDGERKYHLPKLPKELAHVTNEQIGDFHRGEVPPTVELGPPHNVVRLLSNVSQQDEVLAREVGDSRWCGRRFDWLAPVVGVRALVVEPSR